MKRVIYLPDDLNNNKYVLKEEYEGHGIYQHKCPAGWLVHQDWAIVRESDGFTIMIPSYNDMCKEEVLDAIDYYNDDKKYGIKVIKTLKGVENGYVVMHNSGKEM